MAVVYATQHGSKVQKVDERLVISKNGQALEDIPLIKVERLVVIGQSITVTTPALYALTRRGIGVIYLSGSGRFEVGTHGPEHKESRLRFHQALAVADGRRTLATAREIVRAKIWNQRALVQRHAERGEWARRALEGMAAMARRVDEARTLDELRGFEGNAAREYFGLFRRLLKNPMGFERRAYYPPTDPVNALLSFGYTLLQRDVEAACRVAGLDPALGFFHALDFGRPSLALDLEEPFRPVIVDSLVLDLVNHNRLGPADFQAQKDGRPTEIQNPKSKIQNPGVYLTDAARRRFITAYEGRINATTTYPQREGQVAEKTSYRRVLLLQAYQMGRVILGEEDAFRPWRVR